MRTTMTPPESPDPESTAARSWRSAHDCCSSFLLPWCPVRCFSDLRELMAGTRIKVESVKPLQFLDAFERYSVERRFAVEGVQHNAFEQVAQRHIVIFGEPLQHFEDALLHPDARLDSFDEKPGISVRHGTNVPWYHNGYKTRKCG